MMVDDAFESAKTLIEEVSSRLDDIETEADARLQLIDRFLTDVLGWKYPDIKVEPHNPSGYTDYLLSSSGKNIFVIEAKRLGKSLLDTRSATVRPYNISGPALKSAYDGIEQAAEYSFQNGVSFAAVTTGNVWIAFLPFPDGKRFSDGKAQVFPNLESIIANFSEFYDLFAKQAVLEKLYKLVIMKSEGLVIRKHDDYACAVPLSAIHLAPKNKLATDLDAVFQGFFGVMSGESDPAMLKHCFVETRESQQADASMEKIAREITSKIEALKLSRGDRLAAEIEASIESRIGETVLIVGKSGAGKTTFVERFFDLVLDREIRGKCFLVRVDLMDSAGDEDTVFSWLMDKMIDIIEIGLFKDGVADYEELLGLYFGDYKKWAVGEFRPLYESDKTAFKIKFGEYIHNKRIHNREGYLHRLLRDIVDNRQLMPCLVFDNADNFTQTFQERVFQFAQSLHRASNCTFLILPITDRTLWKLSKEGPFQSHPSKTFYLPVPSSKNVIERRISYLKSKISAENGREDTKSYLLSRGIRVNIDNLRGFAAALEEVFVATDFVSRRIGWLANHNIRRSLDLTQRVMTSPVLSVDDLVAAYLANNNISVDYGRFMKSLILGNYNYFSKEDSSYICNVFNIDDELFGSPILKLSVLKLLIDRSGDHDSQAEGYLTVRQIRDYVEPMGVSDIEVDRAIGELLDFRLVEPYDPSDDSVFSEQRIAITHSGRMHMELALTDAEYVAQMAICSPIRNKQTVEVMVSNLSNEGDTKDWDSIRSVFLEYCLGEDWTVCRIPADAMYDGQRQIRNDLRGKWVNPALESSETETNGVAGATRGEGAQLSEHKSMAHMVATVVGFNEGKGYGFVRIEETQEEAFIHARHIRKLGVSKLAVGDQVTCDIVTGDRGLTVVTIHTIDSMSDRDFDDDDYMQSTVVSYDPVRRYGFVFVASQNEDIYFHGGLFDNIGDEEPDVGDNLEVVLGPGTSGRQWQVIHARRITASP